jgi:hypothetical protein
LLDEAAQEELRLELADPVLAYTSDSCGMNPKHFPCQPRKRRSFSSLYGQLQEKVVDDVAIRGQQFNNFK